MLILFFGYSILYTRAPHWLSRECDIDKVGGIFELGCVQFIVSVGPKSRRYVLEPGLKEMPALVLPDAGPGPSVFTARDVHPLV